MRFNYSEYTIINRGSNYVGKDYIERRFAVGQGAIESVGLMDFSTLNGVVGDTYTSYTGVEYASPVLQIAMDFAYYMRDTAFMKFLEKIEKYHSDTYELSYKAEGIALGVAEDSERSVKATERVQKEISAIESDKHMGVTARKKKLVAKRKELREIQVQAEKNKKRAVNKYIRLRKKVHAKQQAYGRHFNYDKIKKYMDILNFINLHGCDRILEQRELREINSSEPKYYSTESMRRDPYCPLVINRSKEQELFEELKEQFYSNNTKKRL